MPKSKHQVPGRVRSAYEFIKAHRKLLIPLERRDVGVVDRARLENVCTGTLTVGSNPTLSGRFSMGFSAKSLRFS